MSAPVDAFGAGMRGDPAPDIHDMKLPGLPAVVGGNQRVHHLARAAPFAQQFHAVDAIVGIDQRLRRNAADTGGDMRHARPDREKPGRNGDADLAG